MNAFDPWVMLTSSFKSLANEPEPSHLIEGVIPEGAICFLTGMPGVGKSWIAQDWALSVATGKDWNGAATQKSKVLYLVAEDTPRLIAKRFEAWTNAWNTDYEDNFLRFTYPVDIRDKNLVSALGTIFLESAHAPNMVILDTLFASTRGLNLKEQKDIQHVQEFAETIKQASGGTCAVVIVSHSTKAGETDISGSVQLTGMADVILSVAKTFNGKGIKVSCTKNKHGAQDFVATFTLAETVMPYGEPLVYLKPDAEVSKSPVNSDLLGYWADRSETDSVRATDLVAWAMTRLRCSKRSVYNRLKHLVVAGLLEQDSEGLYRVSKPNSAETKTHQLLEIAADLF